VLRFACEEVVPRLARTSDEIDNLLHGLSGGFVPAGPSGSPTRGLVGVLPTGRNFYSVDPKAIPSRNAWEVGRALGDSLLSRYLADHGEYPSSVGLVVWGTSAMRTAGDDIAEALWLLGVRRSGTSLAPRHGARGRAAGRARPTARRRHAADQRVLPRRLPARRRHAGRRRADGGRLDERRTTTSCARTSTPTSLPEPTCVGRRRACSGPSPVPTEPGLLPLIDSRDWKTDADLAEVYAVWGGYAYGKGLDGARPAATWSASTSACASRPRTRTPASTTSSTATTTSSTTAAWWRRSARSPARRPRPTSATAPCRTR
jgi:cobaltochelatase CobN